MLGYILFTNLVFFLFKLTIGILPELSEGKYSVLLNYFMVYLEKVNDPETITINICFV